MGIQLQGLLISAVARDRLPSASCCFPRAISAMTGSIVLALSRPCRAAWLAESIRNAVQISAAPGHRLLPQGRPAPRQAVRSAPDRFDRPILRQRYGPDILFRSSLICFFYNGRISRFSGCNHLNIRRFTPIRNAHGGQFSLTAKKSASF